MESTDKQVGLTTAQLDLIGHQSSVDPALLADGLEQVEREKKATFREAIRHHWRAVLWSALLSMALVMDSFDGSLLGSLYGMPAFKERFGNIMTKTGPAVDPNWQTAGQFVGLPGSFLGLWLCGWGQERYGSRKTYLAGMVAVTLVIFLYVFMQNLPMLLAAQALASGCWSLFNTLSAAYAAEICPIQLRGYATSYISMCWGMGSFIASGVLRGCLTMSGDWAWRLPFTLQWIWPAILITGVFWAPESPWWLVRKGRIEEAKRTLVRTASKGYWDSENRNIDAYIAVIQHTDELERAEAASGSFREMWKGTNRRRTEVEMGCWAIQVWSGTAMTAYAVQFLQSAGMNTVQSFNFNIIITAMNLVGVPIDFVLMRFFGRRPLIIFGLMSLAAALAIIGAFGCVPATVSTLTGIGACCAFINLAYHASVGPLTYTVASEVPASRLRAKTLAWGRAFYVINYNATAQLTPRMVAAGGWGWGSKAAFFWLGGNLLITLWAFFRLPETGGLSFADLDILFANKVSARKFKSTKIVNEVTMEQKVEAIDDKMEVEHVEAPRAVLT